MVQQLTKSDRLAHRYEQPGQQGMRVSIAIDAENQATPDQRERTVRYRVIEAQYLAALNARMGSLRQRLTELEGKVGTP